jgi:short-subunit dehydrogenase
MSAKESQPQRVWITGASSGIGEACAYRYAARKATLILTSSSQQKLEPVAEKCRALGADVTLLPYDLRQLDGIAALVQEAWQWHGGIDILFCNAGVSQRTNIEDTSMEVFHTLMDLNFFAPVEMAKAILPLMLANGGGHIAVTTSIAGRFGFPLRCGYSASKHALYGFFETLQAEYTDKGIRTTIVCPGRVRTDISLNSLDKNGQRRGVMDPGQANGLSAEAAAKKIVRAIDKGKLEVLVGGKELVMVYIKRFFPGLCARLARKIKPV